MTKHRWVVQYEEEKYSYEELKEDGLDDEEIDDILNEPHEYEISVINSDHEFFPEGKRGASWGWGDENKIILLSGEATEEVARITLNRAHEICDVLNMKESE